MDVLENQDENEPSKESQQSECKGEDCSNSHSSVDESEHEPHICHDGDDFCHIEEVDSDDQVEL